MRNVLRPRLSSLESFAAALLLTLGCGSEVLVDDDGEGGAGGDTGPGAGTQGGNNPGGNGQGGEGAGTQQGGNGTGGGGGGCVDPQPVLVDGHDTGIDSCAGGQFHRREDVQCVDSYPDPNTCCGDCGEGFVCSTQSEIGCSCVPACHSDADCADGQLCMCGDPSGVCVQAKCQTDADCGSGEECTSWDYTQGCLYLEFACTTSSDTCGGDLDCANDPAGSMCLVQVDGHRQCGPGGCAIGRPFLVEGDARTAGIEARRDWLEGDFTGLGDGLDMRLRAKLRAAWELTARMEHASVAAFARFAMQLMALGAPSDLIARSTQAMADETKHARLAFAVTSAYAGSDVGPGPLAMDRAMEGGADLATILELVIREGCAGETVAAIEAGEAAAHARDPKIAGVLGVIAEDETQHAELAWLTVKWALDNFGEVARRTVEREVELLQKELSVPVGATETDEDRRLLTHGVVTPEARERIRRTALQKAVLPCLRALLWESVRAAA